MKRAGYCRKIELLRMRSLLTLTLLTTIKISLSGKEYDDLKPSAENNDFQFHESQEPSGDQSQHFCEGNNERCKVRSM